MIRRVVSVVVMVTLLAAGLAAAVGAQTVARPEPPGPADAPTEPRYAIALEPGTLRRGADVASEAVLSFEAGAVFVFLGETTDTFGREWQLLGDPAAWQRQRRWVVVPEGLELAGSFDRLAAVTAVPPPSSGTTAAERPQPIAVSERWWETAVSVPSGELSGRGDRLGLPARAVSSEVAADALRLVGGLAALGPMPERPSPGQLHVPALLPLALAYDGETWRLLEPARLLQESIGVLGNATLAVDPVAPPEASGPQVACWDLVGGIDARGAVVGRLSVAPPPGPPPSPAARPADARLLGIFDLGARTGSLGDPAMVAPRRLAPPALGGGVLIDDASRRQAVFLQQRLPADVVQRLRGRAVTLEVVVRAAPELDGTVSTATPAIEIAAGTLRETVSAPVGAAPERMSLTVELPAAASEVVVRLLPVDRSIAVQEAGRAIFDAAYLRPAEWPQRLARAPLVVRRERVTSYAPARRHSRAEFAVSDRAPEELRALWVQLEELDLELDARRAVLSATLEPGMSTAAVRLAWDAPDRVETGSLERWRWHDRTAVFENDELVAWHRVAEAPSPPLRRCHAAGPAR